MDAYGFCMFLLINIIMHKLRDHTMPAMPYLPTLIGGDPGGITERLNWQRAEHGCNYVAETRPPIQAKSNQF